MAEILLSLTIIGVVAAITLPSLTGNINERTWNTQRKALYARMSQAISLMPALNGFGTLREESSAGAGDAVDTAAETFVTSGLAKVLKINNICTYDKLADCGIVSKYIKMDGTQYTVKTNLHAFNSWFSSVSYPSSFYSTTNTNAVAFETQNGESVIAYYNRICKTEYSDAYTNISGTIVAGFPESNMCLNFIYDLNGKKGPNTVGKDVGIITVFNSIDSIVVAPMPSSKNNAKFNNSTNIYWYNVAKACTDENAETRAPNIDELSAILLNGDLLNLTASVRFWSSSDFSSDRAWLVDGLNGYRHSAVKTAGYYTRCVRR